MNNSADASSMDQIPKKKKYLIAFNKFKKITFFGACKVEIDTGDKCLIFRTNSDEKKFKEFGSTFNRIFVQKGNALCIIDGIRNNDFLVIFPLKSSCDRILQEINKAKFPFGNPPTSDPTMDDDLFKNNFYIPILKEIQLKITGYLEIKTIVIDLVNTFKAGQRQIYMNMIFEELIFSTSNNDSSMVNENITVKDAEPKVDVETEGVFDDTANSSLDQSLNETTTTSSSYSLRKRPAINYSQNKSINTSNMSSSTIKKPKLFPPNEINQTLNVRQSNNSSGIIDTVKANYEYVECFQHGSARKRILIFTSDEKNECYEFYFSKTHPYWHKCKVCAQMKQRTIIKIISVENGRIEFKFGKNQHICQPTKYFPDNYKIEELPLKDLKLPTKKEIERKQFNDKEEEVAPKTAPKESRIIQKPNFKIEMVPHRLKSGKTIKRLTICDPAYENRNFTYHVHGTNNKFCCKECMKKRKKYVSAKHVEDDNGNDYIELSHVEHVCL